MADVWLISDTHLGHSNILKFTKDDGTLLRPGFRDVHHMDAAICENWCRAVKPRDKVYHLGDVAFRKESLELIRGLPGHKRLVRGNHDLFSLKSYLGIFEEVYGVRQIDRFWLTHVPMHVQSMHRAIANVHGHLHYSLVKAEDQQPDKRYINVCVEHTGMAPINFEEVRDTAKKRGLL